MQSSTVSGGRHPDPAFLNLMLELDELKQNHGARRQLSFSFLWMLLGFAIGGVIVMHWAG